MNIFNITLDISKNHVKPSKLVTMGQGDKGGTTIVATVTDNGSVVSLTGLEARFVMRLPDGIHYVREQCLIQDGKAVYTVDESKAATVAGYTDEAYFEFDTGTFVYSTERFRVKVLRSALDGSERPQSWDDVDPSGGDDPEPPSLGTKTISANGTYNAFSDGLDGFSSVVVTVPNTYSVADEGMAVMSGALVQQGSSSVSANSTYDTTYLSTVTVDVPNTYSSVDQGKVVSSNSLVAQGTSTFTANSTYDTTFFKTVTVNVPTGGGGGGTYGSQTFTENGEYLPATYGYDAFSAVTVSVPNTYSEADIGKAVSTNGLVAQGSSTLASNASYDTTYISSVVVSVPNSYSAADDGKVVSNGTLSVQGTSTFTLNSTYDTTLISEVTVSVSGGGGGGFTADDIAERKISGNISGSASFIGINAFRNCDFITAASFPSCTVISGYAFAACYAFATANFPACTTISSYAFYGCSALTTASFPSCTSIGNNAFSDCHKLTSLYLNNVSRVTTLGTNAFSGTPILNSDYLSGEYGSVFVPSSLYNAFCTATNWSSISARLVSV